MKTKLILAMLFLCAVCAVNAQETSESNLTGGEVSAVKTSASNEKSFDRTAAKKSLQQTSGYTRPTADKRFKRYINSVIGPFALAGNALGAGISTAANEPEEWGKKWEGFGRRFASNMGRTAIRNTTVYALDEAFKLDSHFYRSEKRDAGSRIKNAFLSTVTARKANGKRVIGVPRLVGTYAASIIASETWYPRRFDYKDGLRDGTISLGINTAVNLIREFIWKK